MNDDNDDKKDLAASDSIRKFLNMNNLDDEETSPPDDLPIEGLPVADLPVADLPIVQAEAVEVSAEAEKPKPKPEIKTVGELLQQTRVAAPHKPSTSELLEEEHQKITSPFLRIIKSVLPYVVIFAIGLGLYFFYFSDFSINSIFKPNNLTIENVVSSKSNKDLDKLKSDQKDAYLKWMKQFFFEVNDEAIISMDTDVSGNGLTNFEKYLLNLNPKVYSSRGSNTPDGQLVIEDVSPWTGKAFTDTQKELVNKYINKENISNRITAAALTRGITKFAQYVNSDSPYYVDPKTLASANVNSNANANLDGSQSEVQSNQTAAQTAQQVNSGSNTGNQPGNLNPGTDINLSIPGKLEIPTNKISTPLIWTKAVKDFDADLKKGIVHYPGTALPGQIGTSYLSGHSSGYLWDKSPYKTIFAGLGGVQTGTSFTITATQNDGKQVVLHYVVAGRGEYAANDQTQFVNTADSVVALSTCWPIGTTARRLVIFGKLSQTEQF